jgi:hypothetical protein
MRCVLSVLVVMGISLPAAAIEKSEVELLTSIITATLAKESRLEVLSSSDVKRIVQLEGERQALGCSESTCLAEIAGAMGAQLVVYGDIGKLGSQMVLTLNLFDGATATAPGREVIVAASLDELTGKVQATTTSLVAPIVAAPGTEKIRVVVLGFDIRGASAETTTPAALPPPAAGPTTPPLVYAGVGSAVVGGIAAVVSVGAFIYAVDAHNKAEDLSLKVDEAAVFYDDRDTLGVVGFAAGGVAVAAVVAGVALIVFSPEP